jgi:hypothetical protein
MNNNRLKLKFYTNRFDKLNSKTDYRLTINTIFDIKQIPNLITDFVNYSDFQLFGINGGYRNLLLDFGIQSSNNSDFNYYSFVGAGFLPGNSKTKLIGFEFSSLVVSINNKGVKLAFPNSRDVFEVSTTLFCSIYSSLKFGKPFLELFFDYSTKSSISTVQNNKGK